MIDIPGKNPIPDEASYTRAQFWLHFIAKKYPRMPANELYHNMWAFRLLAEAAAHFKHKDAVRSYLFEDRSELHISLGSVVVRSHA